MPNAPIQVRRNYFSPNDPERVKAELLKYATGYFCDLGEGFGNEFPGATKYDLSNFISADMGKEDAGLYLS